MRCAVNAENKILFERPGSDVAHKLFISGLLATTMSIWSEPHEENGDDDTYEGSSFLAYASEKSSTPPTHIMRASLSRVWKPDTRPIALPAQRPSPLRSAASNTGSAPASESASDAKLSAGARRTGTKSGLLPSAKGMPENHTGGVLGVSKGCCGGTETGITLGGVSRAGKWEISGVPGGGRTRENSEARVKMGVWLGERATIRFVPALRAATRDCGVMSEAKATEGQVGKQSDV
jgi:hypothetical protein